MMVLYNLKSTRERARAFGDVVYRNMLGLPATALGATLLGVGMAISGSCPGTVSACTRLCINSPQTCRTVA